MDWVSFCIVMFVLIPLYIIYLYLEWQSVKARNLTNELTKDLMKDIMESQQTIMGELTEIKKCLKPEEEDTKED